jgi:hypothetical protein
MSLASGARLGPYEITSKLGAGGMGEVAPRCSGAAASSRTRPMAGKTAPRLQDATTRSAQEAKVTIFDLAPQIPDHLF